MANGEGGDPGSPEVTATGRVTPVAAVWHTLLFVAVLLGLAVLQGQPQLVKGGHLPSRITLYLFTVGYEFFLLGYVWLFGLRRYKVSLGEIIGGKWLRWQDFWRDVGIAILFWIVVGAMLVAVSLSLHFSGMEAAKFLLPQSSLELAVFLVLVCSAGFCEEVIFRGYLQRQFTAWTGNVPAGVALQGVVFGAAHLYQGGKAVVVISVYGAMFGILAAMRKSLRPGIMQHTAQDALSGIAGMFLKKYKYLQIIKF
jgi:membrane protease YdiL (CAAX protease family)